MKIRSEDDALEAGRAARAAGKPRVCPLKKYPVAGLRDAWLRGYDEEIHVPEVRVTVQSVEVKTREAIVRWPDSRPMPVVYQRATPYPCPLCKALWKGLSQAIRVRGTGNGFAYLECRVCGEFPKMRLA